MNENNPHPPLVVLVGPTAVGKTAVAIYLAEQLNAEIVSADSRQIYQKMSIGTAQPTVDEQRHARHHLVDFLDPAAPYTLAEYQRQAYTAINSVLAAEKLPLLVGGSGQYVRAIVEGWGIPEVPPQAELRKKFEEIAQVQGAEVLHHMLKGTDPAAAAAIDYRNVRRVVRALEVYHVTGIPISELQKRTPPPYTVLQIGLTRPRGRLYERADARIESMLSAGFVAEVQSLIDAGYSRELPALSSLGYSELWGYLGGECSLDEAVALIKKSTRRFIRVQYNWFSLNNKSIHWFDMEETDKLQIGTFVKKWLGR